MKKARVFISCGQRDGEKEIGLKVADYFRKKGFDPYFAQEIQTPEGLTNDIFAALEISEYYISINFERDNTNIGSLFIQQEFAIASFRKIEMLSFHKGKIDLEGVGKYLVLKSVSFSETKDIISYLKTNTKHWDPISIHRLDLTCNNHHSNMATQNMPTAPLSNWLHIVVKNMSNKFYCKNSYAYVESIRDLSTNKELLGKDDYKTELVWAGVDTVSVNIPQGGKRDFDMLVWYQGTNSIQFHQRSTSTSYSYPILTYGKYEIIYGVLSDNFPTAKLLINIEFSSTGIAILNSKQIN